MSNMITTMTTVHGNTIDFLNPKEEAIVLEDISLPLAQVCCYKSDNVPFYSIAQHSLNCSKIAREKYDEKMALYLLLHDAKIAYVSNAADSLKTLVAEVRLLEKNIEMAIYHHFGLEYPNSCLYMERIKEIDCGILANEIPVILPQLAGILPKDMLPYPIELDFRERSVEDVKEEYEDTLNYLVKKYRR